MKNIFKKVFILLTFFVCVLSLASCDRYAGLVTPTEDITEDVTEDITEDLTEDVTGDVTEDVTEDVTQGGEGNGGSSGSTSSVTKVSILFHVDKNSAEGKAYQKRISAFNSYYKDKYKASASYVARTTGASMYEAELTNKKVDGTLPDIITFDAPNCSAYAKAKLLYKLDGLIPQNEINDFISVSKFEGGIYGLPIQESSAGFFYNKEMFRKAGIDVSGYTVDNPWTFQQFKDVCAKLKKAGYAKAVDMRLDATKDEMGTYLLYSFIYAAGGQFVSEDGYTAQGYFNSDATAKGFEFIKSLVDAGYTGYDIQPTDFYNKVIPMYLSSGWTIDEIDNKYRENFPNRDSWGLLPYPKDVKAASATGSWCFGITDNNTKDKTAAAALLSWMTSTESSKVITDATGMIPARKSVETNYEVNSPEYVLYQQLLKTGTPRPETVGYPKFSTAFSQVIYNLKSGDVKQILNSQTVTLQRELDSLKKR